MDGYQREITLINRVLEENPKGMTVTDISRKIKINRNSVAKYLDIMRISGYVDMITFGPAKVFFPIRRVPITDMLNYTSDYILIFDADLKITMANDSFLKFMNIARGELIGQTINSAFLKIFKDHTNILIGIKEALEGKKLTQDIDFQMNKERYFCRVSIVPTTFEDGGHGCTIVIKNNTFRKITENALIESGENFRYLLKKIKK